MNIWLSGDRGERRLRFPEFIDHLTTVVHPDARGQKAMRGIAPFPLFAVECRALLPRAVRALKSRNRVAATATLRERAMAEPSLGTSQSGGSPEDRLDSWKDVAAYLNRDVTTVQRWEKRERMPVHRHLHDRGGSVYAFRSELDAWARVRSARPAAESPTSPNDAPQSEAEIPPPDHPLAGAAPGNRVPIWTTLLSLGLVAALAIGVAMRIKTMEYFWQNPLADANFQPITDFDGTEQAAAISRDGQFLAFLSDRDGKMDVWVTQVASGQFHNLTRGGAGELVNPSVRTLGFSPDGAFVTFWVRKPKGASGSDIGIWEVPILGGQPRPYLEGVAEFDWSRDGSRLAYHTPGPGDPLFVSAGMARSGARPVFAAPAGQHTHFPLWSPDSTFIYFVQGLLPDKLDIWRISSSGGTPERITSHTGRVSYPVLLDQRTLVYLLGGSDGSGPWLYSMDAERRIPHRVTSAPDRYTSLAASADGLHLVATLARPTRTLWHLPIDGSPVDLSRAAKVPLTTGTGFSPRLGPDYLLHVSTTGTSESIWKITNGTGTELWRGQGSQILGGPAVSPSGRSVAFSVQREGKMLLYVMQADGTNARIVADSLDLRGAPAWSPDGRTITSAAYDHGIPHLFRIPVDGRVPTSFVEGYSVDPAWSPDGQFLIYSGPDIGTTFSVKAVTADAAARPLPTLTLTRGARHLVFLSGGKEIVHLRGEIGHKNLWLVEVETGAMRQLTDLPPDFDISDFDVSPDGHEVVLERLQEHSDVVLLTRPRR
jgi:Tol biopolymer transport system component